MTNESEKKNLHKLSQILRGKIRMKWVVCIGISFFLMSCGLLQSCNQEESGVEVNTQKSWSEQNQDYLLENANKEGVQKTDSGLQYKVIKEGEGKSPQSHQSVEVHYQGKFINGDEFDSSYKRDQRITFRLDQVISGWTEGLQLMKEGAHYEFYIPSNLGYGSSQNGPIPAHSTLIFQVELFKVLD